MGYRKGIADLGSVGTAADPWTLDLKLEEFSEGTRTSKNEESGCEKKAEDVPEEVTFGKK